MKRHANHDKVPTDSSAVASELEEYVRASAGHEVALPGNAPFETSTLISELHAPWSEGHLDVRAASEPLLIPMKEAGPPLHGTGCPLQLPQTGQQVHQMHSTVQSGCACGYSCHINLEQPFSDWARAPLGPTTSHGSNQPGHECVQCQAHSAKLACSGRVLCDMPEQNTSSMPSSHQQHYTLLDACPVAQTIPAWTPSRV